jgi:alanyl-tRNA synthetase
VTDRLYYTDSHLTDFDATVIECSSLDGRNVVVLDRTAFYPTSGGQPFDTGDLGGARVLEVTDRDADSAVAHVLDRPIPPGQTVHGRVDWVRRFDHMQQHTGQHILSAAFVRTSGFRTESFHLGGDACTIDLSASPDADQVRAAEDEANRIVWEDRAVGVRFVSAAEAAALPFRKEPARSGLLRVVDVSNYDLSACGGTHVVTTGAIGVIAVLGFERFKGGVRVEFACGGRALQRFRQLRDAVAGSVRRLSVLPSELPDAIERLQVDSRSARQQLRTTEERLATFEAEALAASAKDGLVAAVVPGEDAQGLKTLATAIAARRAHRAVLVSATRPALIAIARAPDAPGDAQAVLKALLQQFGGRGGGRPELAQGGGLDAEPDAIREAALRLMR